MFKALQAPYCLCHILFFSFFKQPFKIYILKKISYLLSRTEQVTDSSLSIFIVNNNYELTVYRIYTVYTTEISLSLISHLFNRLPFPKAGSKTRNALY